MTARRVCRPPANCDAGARRWPRARWPVRAAGGLGGRKDDRQDAGTVAWVTIVRAESDVGLPKRAGPVGKRQAIGDVDDIFADARIALAFAPIRRIDRRLKRRDVIEAVRQLELERAPVADVHQRVDARQAVAFAHAAQQRLRGRTRLGGIEADAAVHGAHRLAFLGRRRPSHGGLGRRPAAHRVVRRPTRWPRRSMTSAPSRTMAASPGATTNVQHVRPWSPFFGISILPLNVAPSAIATFGEISPPSMTPPARNSNFSFAETLPFTVPRTMTTLATISASSLALAPTVSTCSGSRSSLRRGRRASNLRRH